MLRSIDTLKTGFIDFIVFESLMLTISMQNNYTMNHNGSDIFYWESISNLFNYDASIASIQKKFNEHLPLNTTDVIDTQ